MAEAVDLIVLSDLHMGRGVNAQTGRFARLEAFFYDDELAAFCRYLVRDAAARGVTLRVVLAGDVFDLLRVDDDAGARRFQPVSSPLHAAELVGDILAGHPGFVWGLAHLLDAGHEVVFLPGNHDVELQWHEPQACVRAAVAAAMSGDRASAERRLATQLRFEPWFHHEPGRIWIEHGSQYDPEGAFRFPLRAHAAGMAAGALERDLPLGNFFQRYLFNGFGPTAFIVPSSDANQRYLKWMMLHRPRRVARAIARHVPFVWRLLRRLTRAPDQGLDALRRAHETQLAELAASSRLGATLERVDALKQASTDVVGAARAAAAQVGLFFGSLVGLLVFAAGLSYLSAEAPRALAWTFAPRLVFYLAVCTLTVLVTLATAAYLLVRRPDQRGDHMHAAAEQLAVLLDVPLVVFGHTHAEDVRRLQARAGHAWYYNTGTWISVFTRDVLLPRAPVQLTYLHVRGSTASLLHYDAASDAPRRVIVLDDGED